jgi:hypothetical protein
MKAANMDKQKSIETIIEVTKCMKKLYRVKEFKEFKQQFIRQRFKIHFRYRLLGVY